MEKGDDSNRNGDRMRKKGQLSATLVMGTALMGGTLGCSDDISTDSPGFSDFNCSINQSELQNGGPGKDGIPALTNPTFVRQGESGTGYLRADDRVAGFLGDSGPLAIPLNIFWWHEIVNLDNGGSQVAITHCPLTGSTLAFDRATVGGAELGVSGLLYRNNLVMYDRQTGESLWPQMLRGARCGPADGNSLPMVPIVEMTWEGWRRLHPDTRVVSEETGFGRDYQSYPYGNYDNPTNSALLFPGSIDGRRPPKERVLGIPLGSGGITFPFGILDEMGEVAVAETSVLGEPYVVFWDRAGQSAIAYHASLDQEQLSFSVNDGLIIDDNTGSEWRMDGRATEGTLAGRRLEAVPEAFVAFWFAWPAFYPEIQIWSSP